MIESELRCEHKLHGILRETVLEVKCTSRLCGAGDGAVVLHHFSALTGELLSTERFANPQPTYKGGS